MADNMSKRLTFNNFFTLLQDSNERKSQTDGKEPETSKEDEDNNMNMNKKKDIRKPEAELDEPSDPDSIRNPFTDSSSSEWEPNSSDHDDDEDIEFSSEETANKSLGTCKSSPLKSKTAPSTPCHSVDQVSDSCSSAGSVSPQYPILSTTDTEAPTIGIQPQCKKWSKYHSCFYCDKQIIKMARHLEMKHSNELSIGQILSLPKGSDERRKSWLKIIKEGDYKHNFYVLDKGDGTLIPKYRGKNVQVNSLVPCSTCKGLYRKKKLAAHSLACCSRKPGRAYREGSLMLPVPKKISKSLWQNVLLKMKDDPISRKAKNDSLIIAFGERTYHKRDVEEHTASQISGRMRELARLVIDLEDPSNGNIRSLTEALLVKHFDTLVASVRSVADYSDETHSFGKGSLALKLGFSIKKSAFILKSRAIQNSDPMQIDNANNLLSLFTGNWCDHISSSANQSLERKKFNKPQLLPCCQDVEKLYTYVKNLKVDDYPSAAKAALCEILSLTEKEVVRFNV